MSKRIAEILEECRVVAQNAESDVDIKTALAIYGFTPEDLLGGKRCILMFLTCLACNRGRIRS